jgi:MFS family permease
MNTKTKFLSKSPFVIATVAGASVIGADILWLAGELLTHFGVFTPEFYLAWRFMIMIFLVLGFVACVLAVKYYLSNGYVRNEMCIEREHKARQIKCNKIFK